MTTPPPVQVLTGALVVQGPALRDLYYLVSAGIRKASRTGYSTTRFEGIRRAVREADASCTRQGDVAEDAPWAHSTTDDETLIDTGEAAALLGVSRRTAQRLARKGLGRQVAGRWLLDRSLVIAEREAPKGTISI